MNFIAKDSSYVLLDEISLAVMKATLSMISDPYKQLKPDEISALFRYKVALKEKP